MPSQHVTPRWLVGLPRCVNDRALFLHDGTRGRVFVHAIRSGAGRARGGCHRWTLPGVALRRLKNGNAEDTDSEQRKKTVDRGTQGVSAPECRIRVERHDK